MSSPPTSVDVASHDGWVSVEVAYPVPGRSVDVRTGDGDEQVVNVLLEEVKLVHGEVDPRWRYPNGDIPRPGAVTHWRAAGPPPVQDGPVA